MDWRLLVGGAQGELVLILGSGQNGTSLRKILLGAHQDQRITLIRGDSSQFPVAPGIADWVIFDPDQRVESGIVDRALHALKPGGHIAIGSRNRWGLGRPAAFVRLHALLRRAGAEQVRSYAVLPHFEGPRAILPVIPRSPATVQKFAIEQAWRRISPISALARRSLGLLVDLRLMRYLFPSYLVIGRKPC